jgi:hypothetical protein
LYLSNNTLTGSIPTQLGQFNTLWLYNNALTGSIPEAVCLGASPFIDCGEIACSCCFGVNGASCPI